MGASLDYVCGVDYKRAAFTENLLFRLDLRVNYSVHLAKNRHFAESKIYSIFAHEMNKKVTPRPTTRAQI